MLQPKPPGFDEHQYQFTLPLKCSEEVAWKWLNDPKTFTDNQIWPFKVEFYSPDPQNIPSGFHEGVITNHHGPFINFAGELTTIGEHYRDLQYYYGSYALTFRWIRPYRLEFETKKTNTGIDLTCRLSTYVKPFISGLWNKSQKIFWASFKSWAKKSTSKLQKQNSVA